LQIGGKTYPFSGQFAADGSLSATLLRAGLSPLVVTLALDLTGSNDILTGQISGGTWTAELLANRAIFSKTNSPPEAGNKYTVVLPGAPDSLTEPGGDGFGTVAIDNSGNISFSGKLGDGSAVAQKTFISAHGEWPFYVSLYSGNGVILGWLVFSNEPASDLGGAVGWFKLPQPFTGSYTSGFTIQSEAAGSLYKFTNGFPVIPLNQGMGELVLENGTLAQSFTNSFSLDSANKVTSPDKLTLTITTGSGLFRGTAYDPATGKAISFNGALLQKQNRGAGYFRQADLTGRVIIEPQF